MGHPLRRAEQALSSEQIEAILNNATSGVLSLYGDEGYPYGVPVSFAYQNGHIYIHSSPVGEKIDALRKNPKAGFTIIAQDQVIPEKETTLYRSLIAEGKVRILEEEEAKRQGLSLIARKYSNGDEEQIQQDVEEALPHVAVLDFAIVERSGKQAQELVNQKPIDPQK
jgi:nitroimidazol reductase NimA-like FMN-containing flavoprotein (pyridoxamine 5'-phosphate oxidase superfamily)